MRLFTAIFPPEAVRRDIAATFSDLPAAEGLRLPRPENLHFTLAFHGEREAGDVTGFTAAQERAAAGFAPFGVRIRGISGFPPSDGARVLFATPEAGEEEMSALHDGFLEALAPALRPRERGPFRAHLTLSRPRGRLARGQFEALRAEARPWSWEFAVDAIHLVRSTTGPGGARYTVLASASLGR